MHKIFSLTLLMVLATGCFKTAEEIQREQMVDHMKVQLEQSSKIVADLTQQVGYLQSKLDTKFGDLEEKDYQQKTEQQQKAQTFIQTTSQLSAQLAALQIEVENNKKTIAQLEQQISDQKKYINKVNSTLGNIAGPTESTSRSKLQEAHRLYEKGDSKGARNLYLEVLNENKINAAERNHVWLNLGLLDYRDKKYEDALVFFSKIYSNYPKSSLAPRALFYIARSFKNLGKKAEAKASYQELLNKYPKNANANTAKNEMSKL